MLTQYLISEYEDLKNLPTKQHLKIVFKNYIQYLLTEHLQKFVVTASIYLLHLT